MSISFPWRTETFRSNALSNEGVTDAGISDRQDRVLGFRTSALLQARVLLIGAGGLGSAVAGAFVRKGLGHLDIADHDLVETSNLNRQSFYPQDLSHPKALCLARNAAREGCQESAVRGHHVGFTQESARQLAANCHLALCCVDNNATRHFAAGFFRQRNVPVIFSAVNEESTYGWVFIQEPTDTCLACVFPRMAAADPSPQPCAPTPAVLDILRVVGGIMLFATDSLLMDRKRHWNFRSVHLSGGAPDVNCTVSPKPACPVCQGRVAP